MIVFPKCCSGEAESTLFGSKKAPLLVRTQRSLNHSYQLDNRFIFLVFFVTGVSESNRTDILGREL